MKPKKSKDFDKRIEAVWCVDSETGEEVLMDLKTSEELYRKVRFENTSVSEVVKDVLFGLFVIVASAVIIYGTLVRI